MQLSILPHSFYNRPADAVAKDLLGKILCRRLGQQLFSGRITETEAYLAANDPASHAFRGPTPRTSSLYKSAGHTYIYSIHRWHCLDVVTQDDAPTSVLIRAIEPLSGVKQMQRHRQKQTLTDLTTGPGKLCQALALTRQQDGQLLTLATSEIYIAVTTQASFKQPSIVTTTRIGVTKAQDKPLRFYDANSAYISRK